MLQQYILVNACASLTHTPTLWLMKFSAVKYCGNPFALSVMSARKNNSLYKCPFSPTFSQLYIVKRELCDESKNQFQYLCWFKAVLKSSELKNCVLEWCLQPTQVYGFNQVCCSVGVSLHTLNVFYILSNRMNVRKNHNTRFPQNCLYYGFKQKLSVVNSPNMSVRY